jgi:ferrous iron transport protein B
MSDCHTGDGHASGAATLAAGPETPPSKSGTHRVVAVVGAPNSGKSTLFNRMTGLRQKVANYPGVTVEKRMGRAKLSAGKEVLLVDLPGVYSLSPRSEDERITRDILIGQNADLPRPDAIILILDSTNLGRHLTLAAPILSLGLPTLVALNMADDLTSRGGGLDTDSLSKQIGAPVALISARSGQGIGQVVHFLESRPSPPTRVQLPVLSLPVLSDAPRCRDWAAQVSGRSRYSAPAPPIWTRRLDRVFLHPVAGPLVFLAVVIAVFQSIFTAAEPLMNAVDAGIGASGAWLASVLPDSLFRSLLIDGIWSGVGSVIIFLPQILILFLFIGILEDSGYLARAALIADRTMAKAGLQGKSFIPLLSAYACAVPAVLSARTIENSRDRLATIFVAPFITCSARLPVYTLLIAAFVPRQPLLGPILGTRAATMLGLYVLGFVAAFGTAWVLKSSILKSSRTPFMLELPPYRLPTLRSLGLRLFDRSKVFLRRAGTVILGTTIVLWFLCTIPLQDGNPPPIGDSLAGTIGKTIEPLIEPLGLNWKIGIGLITSLAAREVMVATLGTIYGLEADESSLELQQALQAELSFGGAIALLIFFAFAMQCMSTVAVVRRETGGWKWALLQWAYMTGLAYVSALIAYQVISA